MKASTRLSLALLALSACESSAPREGVAKARISSAKGAAQVAPQRAPKDRAGASAADPALTAAEPSLSTPLSDVLSLARQLAREAEARPQRAIRVETLRAAAREVEIVRQRQVLAQPLGALYCTLLQTAHAVGATVCEFADAEAAKAAAQLSRARFDALIPGRSLSVHEQSLLTLTRATSSEAEREVQTLRALFASLAPTALPPH